MNDQERDELFIRVSERTLNIWHVVERLEQHESTQNGCILDNTKCSSGNRLWLKLFTGIGSGFILLLIGALITMVITD